VRSVDVDPDRVDTVTRMLRAVRAVAWVALSLTSLDALTSDAARAQPHPRPMATGEARVRRGTRETRFHLLIDGDAVSLSVETGRCRRGAECEMSWRFLFEGPLYSGPRDLVATFMRSQSSAVRPIEILPMERSTARLVCRTSLTLGTTRLAGRCRLVGPLPTAWRSLPRAFVLTR
jgi:hypothetical protein